MKEILTWEQIQKRFPAQWVGLTNVVYQPNTRTRIEKAVVEYDDLSKDELVKMMSDGICIARYTTPNIASC